MEQSEKIGELTKALVSFQLKVKTIGYDADNPFFKSKYATLTALVESSRIELANAGLAVSQLTEGEGSITTILMHISGEWIRSTLCLKPVKDDPQGRGSAITYARRYAYASILGLVSDEDDDGNAATQPKATIQKPLVKPANTGVGGAMSAKDMANKLGIEKFGSKDKFNSWLIDQGYEANMEGMSEPQIIAVIPRLRGLSNAHVV